MKLPATFAVAFNCVALNAVPEEISAGFAQVMIGVAFRTVIATVAVALLYAVVSVGVKVTDSV